MLMLLKGLLKERLKGVQGLQDLRTTVLQLHYMDHPTGQTDKRHFLQCLKYKGQRHPLSICNTFNCNMSFHAASTGYYKNAEVRGSNEL